MYLDPVYFKPKTGLNPEYREKYGLNRLSVVRQLRYSRNNENSIDLVLFVNGIPIVSIELKNQLSGQSLGHAIRQYQFDRNPHHEPLLQFKRLLVHFVVDNDSVGMTTRLDGENTRFLPYNRGITNPSVPDDYKVAYLWREILTPTSLLDILENFVLETTESEKEWSSIQGRVVEKKKDLLVFPRYHQLDVIRNLTDQIKREGAGHNYLIQHTTGSGKSYSIGWLAHGLTSLYRHATDTTRLFDTIIVVTDRKVLDRQLQKTLTDLEQTSGVVKSIDKSSQQLKASLAAGKDIIVTTIQKFGVIADTMSKLKGRTFAVIIDEVHSSQSGESSKKLKKSLSVNEYGDEEPEDYQDVLEREIGSRGKQPHILFFGFTGTPKNKTLEIFGRKNEAGQFEPFHAYTMKQSIAEGYTLDTLEHFTQYKRWFKLRTSGADEEELALPEGKVKRELVSFVDSHEETIRQKVSIILNQFVHHTARKINGRARAMVVVRSRRHCVLFQREMVRQMQELQLPYSCLVAFSGSIQHHGKEHTEHSLNTENGLQPAVSIPDGLKDPRYRLLIVSSKFQTGFDEPMIHSLFVDKKLGGVQCVQTLSRLNRTTKGKTDTFVLDFVNEPEEIIQAFQPFYDSTILTGETDSYKLYELETEIRGFHLFTKYEVEEFCKIFYTERESDEKLQPYLNAAVDKWLAIESEEQREHFRSLVNAYCRLYNYLTQIISFRDAELEKLFIYLKYLKKKLPRRSPTAIDLSDSIDLDSLRIQKIGELQLTLEDIKGELDPMSESGSMGSMVEEPLELLSTIVNKLNETFGSGLTEEFKVDINNVFQRIREEPSVQKVMQGDNTDTNKKKYVEEVMSKFFLDFVNTKFELYRTVESPQNKPVLLDMMFNYLRKTMGK